MKKTILTCDRCGKEVDKLTEVGAGARYYYHANNSSALHQHAAEWCDVCCIEWGIQTPGKSVDAAPITPEPTLEDFLREIVREEIEQGRQ